MILLLLTVLGCTHPDTGSARRDTGLPGESKAPEPDSDSDSGDSPPPDSDTGGGGETDQETDSVPVETGDSDTGEPEVVCDRTMKWIYVAAGMQQTCGVHSDGCAECWGLGEEQRQGAYGYYREDKPPDGHYSRIEMYGAFGAWEGPLHACGVSSEDGAHCWGANIFGETDVAVPDSIDISVGEYETYGLDSSGNAWGIGYRPELPPIGTYVDIAIGSSTGYVREADGTMLQWPIHNDDPAWVKYLDDKYLQVDVKSYACGVRDDGSVRCWDPGDPNGELESELVANIPVGSYVSACVKSADNACALGTDGSVACWGSPSAYDDSPPVGQTFTQISCGAAHVCGITTDNDLVCWGYNEYGEADTPT